MGRSPRVTHLQKVAHRGVKKIGLSFSVEKNDIKKVQKLFPLFFSLSQLKIESYFIQSVSACMSSV